MNIRMILTSFALAIVGILNGQIVSVDVNLNFNHTLDTVTSFDRSKFVAIHADPLEPEWDGFGTNFTPDLRDHFLNGYDVYLGRNTGPASDAMKNASQDANRSGYADTNSIKTLGNNFISSFYKPIMYPYESRSEIIACAQLHPCWPDGQNNSKGWAFSQEDTEEDPFGTASGEALAHYLRSYYGTGGATGQPKPKYYEIINEPIWHVVEQDATHEPIDVFRFHNSVAREIKKLNPDVKVGGWCTAFPDFEKNNFQQWEERWKLFMDTAGINMDFWTIHLYDFAALGGTEQFRKGSNMEATFDMMEQYSYMKFGTPKEFVVSEYGGTVHDYQGAWSPYRDWLHIKSVNSMMMQFMERANIMGMTTNFLIIKATWGTSGVNGTYPHRLMRMANEPESLTGIWVYSEMVKNYQLWANVNGKRIDSKSNDLDVLTDTYIDGNKAYLILNNLAFENKTIELNLEEANGLTINNLMVKDLYLDDSNPIKDQNSPILDTTVYTSNYPTQITLKPEATVILEYTFSGDITIDQTSSEKKYYADSYYKPIVKNVENVFNINGVTKSTYGEATLRLGLGRPHRRSLRPLLYVNDSLLNVPVNFRGDNQIQRASYFGVIEVDIPYDVLETNNEIKVKFTDDGGFISSVTLQAYEFTEEITRTQTDVIDSLTISPKTADILIETGMQFAEQIYPLNSTKKTVEWLSLDTTIAKVTSTGWVTAIALGETKIVVKTPDGAYSDTASILVANVLPAISLDDRNKYLTTDYVAGSTMEVIVNYEAGTGSTVTDDLGGVQVMLREILPGWTGIANDYIAWDSSAIGQQTGQAKVTIDLTGVTASEDLPDGNFYFILPRFMSSSGEELAVQGMAPINILRDPNAPVDPDPSGITNNISGTEQIFYPNPTNGIIYIKNHNQFDQAKLYNLAGSEVLSVQINGNSIDISHLKNGVYVIHLINSNERITKKLIIND